MVSVFIFFSFEWTLSLRNHPSLGSKRLLLNANKTIDLSSSLGINYLVHYSALWRSLEVNFEVNMELICSEHGVNGVTFGLSTTVTALERLEKSP